MSTALENSKELPQWGVKYMYVVKLHNYRPLYRKRYDIGP